MYLLGFWCAIVAGTKISLTFILDIKALVSQNMPEYITLNHDVLNFVNLSTIGTR